MEASGFPCPACGDSARATEVDRYIERGQVTQLKLRCSNCRDVFLAKL